jgi:hypothetical protein
VNAKRTDVISPARLQVLLFEDAFAVAREAGAAYSGLALGEAEFVEMLKHFNSIGEVRGHANRLVDVAV